VERIIRLLARVVRRWPWAIVIGSLLVTIVLGGFISQQEQTQGNEGFAPDAPEWTASLTISEKFASNSETPMQVLFESDSGDILTVGGLQAYAAAAEAAVSSKAGQYLSPRADGAIQGFFGPLLQGLQMQGIPVGALADDATVKGAFNDSLAQLPPEFAGFFTQLLSSENTDLSVPSSSGGLMVVWMNVADLDEAGIQEIQFDLAAKLREASSDSVSVQPFSFFLLFEDQDVFQEEIGRLFGTAALIILAILIFVFFIRPRGRRGQDDSTRGARLIPLWVTTAVIGILGAVLLIAPSVITDQMESDIGSDWALRFTGFVFLIGAVVLIRALTTGEPWTRRTIWDLHVLVLFGALGGLTGWGLTEVGLPGVVAGLLGLIVALVGFRFIEWWTRRAWADMGLTLVTIMMSIAWMQGLGVLMGPGYLGWIGAFSEMLQILPILLIGLGVDYSIHLNSRYREELGAGTPVDRSAGRATRTVGVALVLATVTTSVGFLTNVVNPVPALRDFGILAAMGISSAFWLMLTFFPAVRMILDRRAESAERLPTKSFGRGGERLLPRLMGGVSVFAEKVPIPTLIVAFALGGLGVYGTTQLSTEFSFTDFIPEGSAVLETVDALDEQFAGGFGERTQVLVEGDVATVEVHNASVAAWQNMADTENVLNFGGRAAVDFPATIVAQLATPPEFGGGEFYNEEYSAYAFSVGLQQDLTVSSSANVVELYERAVDLAPDQMAAVLAEGDDGSYRFVDMSISTQAGEAGSQQLAADLVDDLAPLTNIDGVTAVATNENIISQVVVKSLSDSQRSSLIITLVAAMLLLILNFLIEARRPFLGVITILPVALVVLWTFGMMAWTGIPFGPVTATISALAIGIGVPYTIHITHRYQEDRQRYDNPNEAIHSTTRHTGGALAGSAFTTVAGFGILVTSSLVPFQQFGKVTVYAISFALIAAVLVLPSMLVLWDRWHRDRGEPIVEHRDIAPIE
jgi:predicted RND superfamily exporter protein